MRAMGNYVEYPDDIIKMQLDNFADKIDNKIQNELMTDLMLKYTQLSSNLEKLVEEKVKEISKLQLATIFALVKLSESRDDDTGKHIERTAELCKLMAKLLSTLPVYMGIIDNNYIETIYKASPLHDIGKVGIPDSILLKPGKLTTEEFEIMKTHAIKGYETLYEVQQKYTHSLFLNMGMDITKYHHEKWDGSGYPMGLKGDKIPLSARIMAIVDVYDALRTKRVYKEAYSHEESCKIIAKGSGKHFDPLLVNVFLDNNHKFMTVHNE